MIVYLLCKSSTGKFRYAVVETNGYNILRSYGQVHGKDTKSPVITVSEGKQKRTLDEQLELQYNSEIKKFLDKGYIIIDSHPNTYTYEELDSFYGNTKTDQKGVIKPQLAKQISKVTDKSIFDKQWLISSKLDGTKALFYYKDGEVRTSSRGGSNYDVSTEYIRNNPKILGIFKSYPNVILDGELFVRNVSLQEINSAVRQEQYPVDWLQYWIYDCYFPDDPDMNAEYRFGFLTTIAVEFKIPIFHGSEEPEQVNILWHEYVTGLDKMMQKHDEFVNEGFEGAVITDPLKPYQPGSKCNNLIKIKMYKSEDFEVIDYELGLRGSEDMVFVCKMKDGRTFKAMPCGSRGLKQEYIDNFESKYKGHLAECTFFNYSDDGIPTQPKMRTFRFDLE